jgi:phosphoribosylformylglycinamidine synthase
MENSFAPWEDSSFTYPPNLASPLQILIDASNGASDYGNKFGEPLIQGYTRTFGMRLPSGERREWLKPIMFSAGIGQIDHRHLTKEDPDIGMLVVKVRFTIQAASVCCPFLICWTHESTLFAQLCVCNVRCDMCGSS